MCQTSSADLSVLGHALKSPPGPPASDPKISANGNHGPGLGPGGGRGRVKGNKRVRESKSRRGKELRHHVFASKAEAGP